MRRHRKRRRQQKPPSHPQQLRRLLSNNNNNNNNKLRSHQQHLQRLLRLRLRQRQTHPVGTMGPAVGMAMIATLMHLAGGVPVEVSFQGRSGLAENSSTFQRKIVLSVARQSTHPVGTMGPAVGMAMIATLMHLAGGVP